MAAIKNNQPIKIRPVPYNHLSEPDPSLVIGETFNCNKPFLLLSSLAIPKNANVYMEVTVTYHPQNDTIRHIPLYLGVHKEPSMGVLANDCILGSLYYTVDHDYQIRERHRGSTDEAIQSVPKLYSRIPIVNTVIGIGVSIMDNTITLYSDGKLFYTIKPTTFSMKQSRDRWYFAIYSELYEGLHGRVNYGRYRTQYMPEGYCHLYAHYFNKLVEGQEFECYMTVPGTEYTDTRKYEFPIQISNIVNTIAPIEQDKHRHPRLIFSRPQMEMSPTSFKMKRNPDKPDMATIDFPCPVDHKVYIEFNVKEGTVNDKFYGIPMTVGISKGTNYEDEYSFSVDLFHRSGDTHHSHSIIDGDKQYHRFPEVTNPSMPVQPNTVGMVFDLSGGFIHIITDNTIFATVPIRRVAFDDPYGIYHIYFKSADEAYTGDLVCLVNTGEESVDFDILPDTKTFYDYWNDSLRFHLEEAPGFPCRMKVRPYYTEFKSFLPCTITVPRVGDIVKGFTPGLNMLMDSYNVVTDTEEYINKPELTPFEFNQRVRDDLTVSSIKKPISDLGMGDIINCKMLIENDNWKGYDILEGSVTFTKSYDYDLDMNLIVTDKPKYDYKFRREILGVLDLHAKKYVQNLIQGTLKLIP